MTSQALSRRSAIGLLGLLVPAGCATVGPEAASSAVPNPMGFLDRVRPSGLGRSLEAVQLVTVNRDSNVFVTEVRLSVRNDQLKLVAQDMLGQRLMTVDWSDSGIVDSRLPNLPSLVSPAGLLADLVAICWPEAVVRLALERTGASLVVQGSQRIVLSGRRETMVATLGWETLAPWTGRMSYRNVRAGYVVDVQSVEQS